MTPLRLEEITLFCEDRSQGRSQKLLEAALQVLSKALPLASEVVPIGISSKNDVQVRAKFARHDRYRAFGLRDRDFLLQAQVDEYRNNAFHKDDAQVRPWPFTRHCIESYLLDDDVLGAVIPAVDAAVLRATVDAAAAARRWLDVARGTLEDLRWRLQKIERRSIKDRPSDRASAMDAVREAADLVRQDLAEAGADDRLAEKLDALAADMEIHGPLRHRVDGRQLVADVEQALVPTHGSSLPKGGLLSALDRDAHQRPPAALLADLRSVLEKVPPGWRSVDA